MLPTILLPAGYHLAQENDEPGMKCKWQRQHVCKACDSLQSHKCRGLTSCSIPGGLASHELQPVAEHKWLIVVGRCPDYRLKRCACKICATMQMDWKSVAVQWLPVSEMQGMEAVDDSARVADATDSASQQGIQTTRVGPVDQPGTDGGLGNAEDGEVQGVDIDHEGHEEEGRQKVEEGCACGAPGLDNDAMSTADLNARCLKCAQISKTANSMRDA